MVYSRCNTSFSIINKTLSGPGLPDMEWQYLYSQNAGAYVAGHGTVSTAVGLPGTLPENIVSAGSTKFKSTTVYTPDGAKAIHYFNREYTSFSEGKEVASQYFDVDGSTILKTNEIAYSIGTGVGYSEIDLENADASRYRSNITSEKVTTRDVNGNSDVYTRTYSGYDIYGNPQITAESNSFSSNTRYTKQIYYNDTTNWLIGLPAQTYTSKTSTFSATPDRETTYYGATSSYKSLPNQVKAFGRWTTQYVSYYTSGNQAGLPAKVSQNATNRWTTFANYKRGIAQTIQKPQPNSTAVQTAYKVVDDNGLVTQQTDYEGNCVNYDYNEVGWLTLVEPCNSAWLASSIDYDVTSGSEGLPLVESGMIKKTVTQGNLLNVSYYDGLQRQRFSKALDTTKQSITQRYSQTDYDAYNRPVYQSKPSATTSTSYGVRTAYDGVGRVKSVVDNTLTGSTTYTYLNSNRVQVNDNRGQVTTTNYLAYGAPAQDKPTMISAPASVVTLLGYNIFGNVLSVSQGGITESRVYDAYQQLCKAIRPDIGNQAFNYDAIGQLTWSAHGSSVDSSTAACDTTVSAGDKITNTYDNHGNLKTVSYGDGITAQKVYDYDRNGNLLDLEYGAVEQHFTYNDLNLLATEQLQVDGLSWTLTHHYDAYGHENSLTYPDGSSVAFSPDALGQPTVVGTFASNISFYPNGVVKSYSQANGCSNSMTLYTSGLPNTQRSLCGSADAVYNQYTWDANGNLTYWDDKQNNAFDLHLTYDGIDRLDNIRDINNVLVGDMDYDTMGNITKFDAIVGTTNYQYDSSKRLISTSGYKAYSFQYDTRGNVTYNGSHSFSYNLANQMTNAGNDSYVYDGQDKRVKTVDAQGTRYGMYTLGGKLIFERINGVNRAYYYLGSQVVAQQQSGVKTYIHPDVLGSTAATSNASGTVTYRMRFAPFGLAWGHTAENEIAYTGHKFDTDTGLNYMQARYYDPLIGRFYSNDPIGVHGIQSFNRFSYANNNPYRYVDPTGMVSESPNVREKQEERNRKSCQDDPNCSYFNFMPRDTGVPAKWGKKPVTNQGAPADGRIDCTYSCQKLAGIMMRLNSQDLAYAAMLHNYYQDQSDMTDLTVVLLGTVLAPDNTVTYLGGNYLTGHKFSRNSFVASFAYGKLTSPIIGYLGQGSAAGFLPWYHNNVWIGFGTTAPVN